MEVRTSRSWSGKQRFNSISFGGDSSPGFGAAGFPALCARCRRLRIGDLGLGIGDSRRRGVGGQCPPYGMVAETPGAGGREDQTNPICAFLRLNTGFAVRNEGKFRVRGGRRYAAMRPPSASGRLPLPAGADRAAEVSVAGEGDPGACRCQPGPTEPQKFLSPGKGTPELQTKPIGRAGTLAIADCGLGIGDSKRWVCGMSNKPNWAARGVGGHGPPCRMVGETPGGRQGVLSPALGSLG